MSPMTWRCLQCTLSMATRIAEDCRSVRRNHLPGGQGEVVVLMLVDKRGARVEMSISMLVLGLAASAIRQNPPTKFTM